MRAVNLLPAERRKGAKGPKGERSGQKFSKIHGIGLAILLAGGALAYYGHGVSGQAGQKALEADDLEASATTLTTQIAAEKAKVQVKPQVSSFDSDKTLVMGLAQARVAARPLHQRPRFDAGRPVVNLVAARRGILGGADEGDLRADREAGAGDGGQDAQLRIGATEDVTLRQRRLSQIEDGRLQQIDAPQKLRAGDDQKKRQQQRRGRRGQPQLAAGEARPGAARQHDLAWPFDHRLRPIRPLPDGSAPRPPGYRKSRPARLLLAGRVRRPASPKRYPPDRWQYRQS